MKTVIVVAGLVGNKGRILVSQRKENVPRGLLWEFPGGKIEEGEAPQKALERELMEELGIEVEVGRIFEAVDHTYPDISILLLVYHCRIKKGLPRPLGCHDLRWVSLDQLNLLAMPPPDEEVRKRLCVLKRPPRFI